MRSRLIAPLVAAALLVPAAPAAAASFVVTLRTPSSQPRANHPWPITVGAHTRSGRRLHATALYQFLHDGYVVSTQYPSPGRRPGTRHSPYPFTGSYRDDLLFPRRAVGIPLTFRVVVRVRGRGSAHQDKKVRVRR